MLSGERHAEKPEVARHDTDRSLAVGFVQRYDRSVEVTWKPAPV
jgi:hypothetical protein